MPPPLRLHSPTHRALPRVGEVGLVGAREGEVRVERRRPQREAHEGGVEGSAQLVRGTRRHFIFMCKLFKKKKRLKQKQQKGSKSYTKSIDIFILSR
jgi:hypothetical protein